MIRHYLKVYKNNELIYKSNPSKIGIAISEQVNFQKKFLTDISESLFQILRIAVDENGSETVRQSLCFQYGNVKK